MKSLAVFLLCIMATNSQIKAAEEKLADLETFATECKARWA